MVKVIIIIFIIFLLFYIILKLYPKFKLIIKKIINSPFIFIIIKNLIKLILRRF